ncbi:MAG: TonB-dependent receptor [Chitinophagaceae bacterium]|nr:TonB-dependent receptor [Chitinophagaceae bacterium]
MRTQIMTEKELFKAACCNLSESFETNPSVDVSYNDAVTGSKQIQLLGLAGAYTQLLVENLTGPRGIATPLGLNSIAGPWIESIQLTKGIGSVANGYESIAGQINVELKKPENSEKLYANAYINSQGKTDLNLNLSHKWAQKWSTALLLHDDFLSNKSMDENRDGFRDLPTGNQFSMINRWKYDNAKGFLMQFGFKILHDNRTGGETGFVPAKDKLTTNHYGLGIETSRYEAFAKIGYVFPEKKYKSIGLQLSAIRHKQDSYFGLSVYDARQQNFYANLIYQSIIGSTVHKFRTGLSFLHDHYDESLKSNRYLRTENIPGFFGEYTFTPSDKFSMIAGIRGDNHNLFGFFFTPRIHLRYEPVKGTTFRMSAGRGQRTASIFAENTSVLVSNRQVQIIGSSTGKAYGLDPEVAWNKGVSLDQKMKLFHRDATLSFDFFRNDFKQQVVVDLENPQLVRFYNLTGKSYSNSFQAEMTLEPARNLELRLAYRYFDVKTTYGDKLLQRPLIAANRAFANVYYTTRGWKFDYTISLNGKKRIPYTGTNPHQYHLNDYSPSYAVMNAQISKTLGKKRPMDFYLGAENLTNYMQHHPILASEDPFGNYFDASMIWGPVNGGMVYVGWRLKMK